jgi:hypothetical protein
MLENRCRNCDQVFAEGQVFCAHCGQRLLVDKLGVGESLRGFWSTMVYPVLVLGRALLVRPGYVAHDYVQGKRKRFLGPYAFLFLTVGLASAAVALSGFQMIHGKELDFGTGAVPLDARAVAATDAFFQRHVNAVILLDTPLLAAFCRLLFRKERISFAEHLVLASYASGIRSLFTTIVMIPSSLIVFRLFATDSIYFLMASVLIWITYFAFAMSQFSRQRGLTSGLKGAMAAVLAWICTQVVISAVATGYILHVSHR